jgi:hypothetical protein
MLGAPLVTKQAYMKYTDTALENYFWEFGNHIVTKEGVEIVLHESALVEMSVLLRNEDDYPQRIQLQANFYSLAAFMNFFAFESYDCIAKITLQDMLALYRIGYAKLEAL